MQVWPNTDGFDSASSFEDLCVSMKGRDKWLHSTVSVRCNYLSLPLVLAKKSSVLNYIAYSTTFAKPGGVSLHMASSPNEFSRGYELIDDPQQNFAFVLPSHLDCDSGQIKISVDVVGTSLDNSVIDFTSQCPVSSSEWDITFIGIHDDVIKWKYFPRYWPFVRGIHRLPVNSPHKGQWRGALMFSLICAWWFETPPRPLWRHCNALVIGIPVIAAFKLGHGSCLTKPLSCLLSDFKGQPQLKQL